jgi:beta-lactamase regulating signal transducer with metallopeptidase domain
VTAILLIVYSAVAVFRVACIGLGLLLVRRLLRTATSVSGEIELDTVPRCRLLESSRTSVPVTIGVFRPAIVLPMAWRGWSSNKLLSALSHEQAHVAPGDWLVTLLAELNRAIHWFNPLAWLLRRRLASLAEYNCDDAVIAEHGNRPEYARHLLEVAATAGARYRPRHCVLAMARRPDVECRIDAILDDVRPLARRTSWRITAVLLALIVPLTLFIASIAPLVSDADEKQADKTKAAPTPVASDKIDTDSFLYEGSVVTATGEPVPDADVRLVYWYSDQSQLPAADPDTRTDVDGRFRFRMKRSDFHRTGDSVPPWQWASLVVTHKEHGIVWGASIAFETTGNVFEELKGGDPNRLRLIKDSIAKQGKKLVLPTNNRPIEGRVVTTEGQPVANATVSLTEVFTGEDNTLVKWTEASENPKADFYSLRRHTPKHIYGPMALLLVPATQTDAKGEFTLRGIGADRLAKIVIQSPTIATAELYCRTQDASKVQVAGSRQASAETIHGNRVTHVATPSKPVSGIVTSEETGKPVPGVLVSSRSITYMAGIGQQSAAGSDFARATTDGNGHYSLTGLPMTAGKPIIFTPPPQLGLLGQSTRANLKEQETTKVEINAELIPGHIVTGRVVNHETGDGVSGYVKYMSIVETARPGLRTLPSTSMNVGTTRADTNGHFGFVVPKRKGFASCQEFDESYEKTARRPNKAVTMADGGLRYATRNEGEPEFHAIADITPPTQGNTVDLKMEVHRAANITGTVVDTEGNKVDGYFFGHTRQGHWQPLDSGKFSIIGLPSGESRRLTFVSQDLRWAGTLSVTGKRAAPWKATLQRAGGVRGRIVDSDGEPISDVTLHVESSGLGATSPRPEAPRQTNEMPIPLPNVDNDQDAFQTDDDGRFEIKGLVSGSTYSFIGWKFKRDVRVFETRGSVAKDIVIQADETIDFGNVTVKQTGSE